MEFSWLIENNNNACMQAGIALLFLLQKGRGGGGDLSSPPAPTGEGYRQEGRGSSSQAVALNDHLPRHSGEKGMWGPTPPSSLLPGRAGMSPLVTRQCHHHHFLSGTSLPSPSSFLPSSFQRGRG